MAERELSVSENPALRIMRLPGRYLSLGFVVAVVLALVGLLTFGLVSGRAGDGIPSVPRRPAPDFSMTLFDGGEFTLSELKGEPVLLNFWASWCDACEEEALVLEQGWQRYRERGVVFVGVDIWDDDGPARAFLERYGITYPNGPVGSKVPIDYGVLGVPESFFIDRDGQIVTRYAGPLSPELLSSFIEQLFFATATPEGS